MISQHAPLPKGLYRTAVRKTSTEHRTGLDEDQIEQVQRHLCYQADSPMLLHWQRDDTDSHGEASNAPGLSSFQN